MRASDIQQFLPEVYRRTVREGGVLSAMLEAMDALHAPAERRLDSFDTALDPRRAEPAFVTYLAGWLDLEGLFDVPQDRPAKGTGNGNDLSNAAVFPAGLGRLRELVAAAASLGRRRGTAEGLRQFLEIATGLDGFTLEEQVAGTDGHPRPFHVRIRCPAAAGHSRTLIDRIIRREKPAYVTYELAFDS